MNWLHQYWISNYWTKPIQRWLIRTERRAGLNAEITDLLILLENVKKGFPSLLCQLLPVRRGRGFWGWEKNKQTIMSVTRLEFSYLTTQYYFCGTGRVLFNNLTPYRLFFQKVLYLENMTKAYRTRVTFDHQLIGFLWDSFSLVFTFWVCKFHRHFSFNPLWALHLVSSPKLPLRNSLPSLEKKKDRQDLWFGIASV